MELLISTWIPRSHIHLREAHSKIDKTGLKVSKVKLDDNFSFTIENVYKKYRADFTLYPTGVYSISIKLADKENVKLAIKTIEDFILKQLIKNWHSVTYKQIKARAIPLVYHTLVFSSKKKSVQPSQDNLIEYVDWKFSTRNRSGYKSYQFAKILTKVVDTYVEMMAKYYHKADIVIRKLKGDFELSELKKTVFEMDFIEKITGETIYRIGDAKDCFLREKKLIENKKFASNIKVGSLFGRLETDLGYVERLWQQLDNFLDNLDNASNARLSYQETVESRRVSWFLSVEATSILATLLASAFISEFTGINAIYLGVIFIVVWIVVYKIMMKLRAR